MSRKCEANPKHAAGIGKVSRMDLTAVEAETLLNSPTAFVAKGVDQTSLACCAEIIFENQLSNIDAK